MTTGSRANVMKGIATRTSGGLTRSDLKRNRQGRIVSVRASAAARQKLANNPKFQHYIDAVKSASGRKKIPLNRRQD